MLTTVQNKYKDNDPKITVDNITNFFISKGYNVKIDTLKEPVPGIYWCHLKLLYNDIVIQTSNGKGVSKEFALASGYSELYERYCTFLGPLGYPINQKKLFELNSLNKYKLFPDEKYITMSYIKEKLPILNRACSAINDINNNLNQYLFENPENLLAFPFVGFNQDDILYVPHNLLALCNGSTGLAAGNTIEEALTQGLSEICEHYVHYQIYCENQTFYYLNLDTIELPQYISHFFNSLKERNYLYYIYDFSYLYQVPVLGLFIVDPLKHVSYLNMAAAPNFTIALERCCTEMYQGHTYLGDNIKQVMLPMQSTNFNEALDTTLSCLTLTQYYPENLILNSQKIDNYNTNIFLDNNNYSNYDFNNYYKQIFDNKRWQVYYRDYSQSKDIKAIRCYVNNIPIMNVNIDMWEHTTNDVKELNWKIAFKWQKLINDYLNTSVLNENLLLEIITLIQLKKEPFADLFRFDFFAMPKKNINMEQTFDEFFLMFQNRQWDTILDNNENNIQELRDYLILILYSNFYTKEEISKISQFYNIFYNEEDFQNNKNLIYLLKKIYFEPYWKYYNSEEYSRIIKTLIPLRP